MSKSARARIAERIRQNEWAFLADMTTFPGAVTEVPHKWHKTPARYHFIDRGADILLVAHCDSVAHGNFMQADTKSVRCPSLDNRIGVYLALVELPLRGIKFDVLLTDDEESCNSSAQHFKTDKKYNWVFSFDRMGYDCALYQYADETTKAAVSAHGYTPVHGSYSDIVELDNLGCKGFNFGIGYRNYHSKDSHILTQDLVNLIKMFTSFYAANKNVRFDHKPATHYYGRNRYGAWDDLAYTPGDYSGYVRKYTGTTWKTRSTAVRTNIGKGAATYDRAKWNSDLDRFAEAYRDTSDDDRAARDTFDDLNDDYGRFPNGVEAIKCEFCDDFFHPHDIAFDWQNEIFLCGHCFEHINGTKVPATAKHRRHLAIHAGDPMDADICHECNAADDSVITHNVYGQTIPLCAECYDYYLNGATA